MQQKTHGAAAQQVTRKVLHPEKTKWAARFKRQAPYSLKDALRLVSTLDSVIITQCDDHSFAGDYVWAIIPNNDPGFWLDAFADLEDARRLCRTMGWPIALIHPPRS